MNRQIEKLHAISAKRTRRIVGLMSGTSLDGLDIALSRISHSGFDSVIQTEQFITMPYSDAFIGMIRSLHSKEGNVLEKTCLLNGYVGQAFGTMVMEALKKWNVHPGDVDLIASHGQTVYHAPASSHKNEMFGNGTLQIGDGDMIASATGIITISDFRQKHIASGGEGAPLAPYGDYLLFSENQADVLMLNIGGIANFTYLPAGRAVDKLICSDTGPGNCLMDGWVQRDFRGKRYDEGGQIAVQGKVQQHLLDALQDHEFFRLPLPKTTGTETFNIRYTEDAIARSGIREISRVDIIATLNYFTAATIAAAISRAVPKDRKLKLFISGGGSHNTVLTNRLRKLMEDREVSFHSTTEKNINPDAKEAILFALLANETVAGHAEVFGKGSKAMPAVSMGKISFPG